MRICIPRLIITTLVVEASETISFHLALCVSASVSTFAIAYMQVHDSSNVPIYKDQGIMLLVGIGKTCYYKYKKLLLGVVHLWFNRILQSTRLIQAARKKNNKQKKSKCRLPHFRVTQSISNQVSVRLPAQWCLRIQRIDLNHLNQCRI